MLACVGIDVVQNQFCNLRGNGEQPSLGLFAFDQIIGARGDVLAVTA